MKLPEAEVDLFYKLYYSLLVYINQKLNIAEDINSLEDLKFHPLEKINKLRDRLYKQPELINAFVTDNPLNFSSEELKIISVWKNYVKGKFIIFRYLKNYTVFLSTDEPVKAYGVMALNTTFEEMVGSYLPIMADIVLLPFRNKITYDTIFFPYSVSFGGGMRRRLNDDYQEAKSKFGIITSLPFSAEKAEQTDSEKLKFYLRSKRNRDMYWQEIDELANKDPNLLILYHQEMGKIHTRIYRKLLREIDLTGLWFAVFEGIIIASGKTKSQLEKNLQDIIPEEKMDLCYVFHMKKK